MSAKYPTGLREKGKVMKKALVLLILTLALTMCLASCKGLHEDVITVEDGYLVVNGVKTEYKVQENDNSVNNDDDFCQHYYDSGKIQIEATNSSAGIKIFTCQKCGTTKIESIPPKGSKPESSEQLKSGVYKIGTDLLPGEYILLSDNSDGYFAICSDAGCNNILANNRFGYITYITAYENTYLELDSCVAIPYTDDFSFNPIENGWTDGVFKCGKDIPCGEYVLISDTSNGYYAFLSGTDGSNIIANDKFGSIAYVNVSENTYLEIRGCRVVPYSEETIYTVIGNGYVTGMYKVGKDLPAGRYKLTAIAGGYYAIQNTPQGNIISNKFFGQGTVYVTVEHGQYITLSGVVVEPID